MYDLHTKIRKMPLGAVDVIIKILEDLHFLMEKALPTYELNRFKYIKPSCRPSTKLKVLPSSSAKKKEKTCQTILNLSKKNIDFRFYRSVTILLIGRFTILQKQWKELQHKMTATRKLRINVSSRSYCSVCVKTLAHCFCKRDTLQWFLRLPATRGTWGNRYV